LTVSESVIQVGFSQPRVQLWWLPERNSDWYLVSGDLASPLAFTSVPRTEP
jgi:hypothetical protein